MDDLINRSDAIALAEEVENKRLRGEIDSTYAPMINGIKALPSAQPERSLWFRIGETCVDESKGFISAERAVEKIRELLREGW